MGTAGSGSRSRGWIESDFRQKPWPSVVDPDQGRIRIRIRINVRSWTQIRIGISLQMTSLSVWKTSLFEHFFKVLSLYLEARILIRIRIKVKGRIRIRIRIHIKVTSRIRIRIKVMRIRNNALALRKVLYFISQIQSITGNRVCPASIRKDQDSKIVHTITWIRFQTQKNGD
jgi:hypothetical protein